MKLSKRECRKYANPELKMNAESGLLHAEQINYVVRTAVKIIDHHKTLILYVYSREQAAHENASPCMAVFHCQDDFITLSMNENGGTKWRTASFDNLGNSWRFTKECAFYSAKDEERVRNYFKGSTDSGFMPLARAQYKIQEKRSMERQRIKESHIVNRMSCIKSLPRGLKGWIQKSVMPSYFFYDYKKGGNDISGVCSSCGREIRFSGVKQGVKKVCPHCRKELICKPRSRRGSYMYDRDTCQVIQHTGDGGLVVRIVKVYYSYQGDIPDIQIYENARQFIYKNTEGKICTEAYYYSYNNGFLLTHWKKGERPKFSPWQYSFEADTCGHVYTGNLPAAISGTPWQYCPVAEFYNHWHEPMESLPFLVSYLNHPRLEHLVKTGFSSIVSDIVYRKKCECLDETQNRMHRILQVAAEDVPFLRDIDVNIAALQIFQTYTGLKDRQKLLLWQIDNHVEHNVLPILQHMTVHKAIKYLDNQYSFLCLRKSKYGTQRYKDMPTLVTEYRDYLDICKKLGYDIKNSFVKYPADLQKAHDKAAKRLKHKADAQAKRQFIAVYKSIAKKYDFETDGMKIVYPEVPDDVVKEGHALHHCVGSYTDRIVNHECVILFLRQCSDPEKSFYTIEIRGIQIVQVRGSGNCAATPEVDKFIRAWEQRVLSQIDAAA